MSGKSVFGHPETERMLRDVRSGRIAGLVFSKLARLARNTRELLEFSDIFREHGADLISLQESIDTSTPAGRLFYTVIAAMAQWEREEIAERTAASVPIRAKLGKRLGGPVPFGYAWKGHQLIVDHQEAPVRKLIHELFLEHRRKKTVARLLNEMGHRTRNGSGFTDTTVDRLLRDPTAKGIRRANYTRSLGDNKPWTLKPKEEWVLHEVEPIVSEDLWGQANALLDAQRRTGRRPARKTVHLFAGIAHCTCGGKLYVPSNSPKYVCFRCRNKIPADDLEAVFQEQLKAFVFSPDQIADALTQSDETIREKEELLRTLETERERLRKDMDRVMEAYLAERLTVDGFGREYGPKEERLKQLEDQIPIVQGEVDFLKIRLLSRDEILSESQDLASRWPDLTQDDRRQIVETIAERIEVGKDEIAIDLVGLPSLKTVVSGQRGVTAALKHQGQR